MNIIDKFNIVTIFPNFHAMINEVLHIGTEEVVIKQ